MAEIGASRRIWPEAKHQLCWWHQREALRRRLKGPLPTSIYNSQRAKHEHAFISLTFKPYGRADPNDCEGSVPGEIVEQEVQKDDSKTGPEDPNSIKIRISTCNLSLGSNHPGSFGGSAEHSVTEVGSTLTSIHPDPLMI